MKTPLLLAFFVLLTATSLTAQSSALHYDSIPNNTITIAPLNDALFGTYNNLYYKRKLAGNEKTRFYLRVGLGLSERFYQELDIDNSQNSDIRGYNFMIGGEWNKKLGNFSLSFGPELSYTRFRFRESVELELLNAAIFGPSTFEANRTSRAEDSRFRMISPTAFVGIKYHIGPHFQIGIESAIGVGYFKLENDYDNFNFVLFDETFTGRVRDFSVGRQFVLECNF